MRWTIYSGQYGVLNSSDSRVKFRDSHELRLGVCYFPNGFSSSSYWKRMSYKCGCFCFHALPAVERTIPAGRIG